MKKCNAGHLRQIHIYFQVIDSQDGAASKERERQMRQEIGRLQTDLDKERIKAKSNAEKVSVPFWEGDGSSSCPLFMGNSF